MIHYSGQQQAQGLMHRKTLDQKGGMLFVFNYPKHVNVWMKDTKIPLDILFIDKEGIIRKIVHSTEPFSLKTIPSGVAVQYVLEINAGMASQMNIHEGDQMHDLKIEEESRP